ncbi:MAG: porin [Elusimicrobiota bacterium]|nr:porin [Elusimicrobiota bacterium]
MKNVLASVMLIGLMSIFTGTVFGVELISTADNQLSIGGRMQMLGVAEILKDSLNTIEKDPLRIFLFQKQARLNLKGKHNSTDYYVEMMFGGEEVPKSNTVMSLLDYYMDTPLFGSHSIKVGQFKVPYGRERLTSPEVLNNADRSIQNLASGVGRDVGFAVHCNQDNMTGTIGVFTGGGMDVPQRYLPEVFGFPMLVVRAGINNKLDRDVFTPYQVERADNDGTRYAAYVNALYTKDSRVGHSTALGTKAGNYAYDKSLLLNSNWNPYISSTLQAEYWQTGADFAVEMPMKGKICSSVIEINYGQYKNDNGSLELLSGMLKESVVIGKYEIGIRYAAIVPDKNMGYYDSVTKKTYQIVDSGIIQEVAPSVVININKSMKIVMDAPIGIDSPVSIETGNGPYDLMKQPDTTSYAKTGKVERQTTYTGRTMFQFVF